MGINLSTNLGVQLALLIECPGSIPGDSCGVHPGVTEKTEPEKENLGVQLKDPPNSSSILKICQTWIRNFCRKIEIELRNCNTNSIGVGAE